MAESRIINLATQRLLRAKRDLPTTWDNLEDLTDQELMESVLSLTLGIEDTRKVAVMLIAHFGSFGKAAAAPPSELSKVEGLGVDGIAALKLLRATNIRMLRAEIRDRPVIDHWQPLVTYLSAIMSDETKEHFRCLFLDARNRLITDRIIATGTINSVHIYPREVIKPALDLHATALIIVHNHPSGSPSPSDWDIKTTEDLVAVCIAVGIEIHDHVIIASGKSFSFRRAGLIKRAQ